MRIHIIYLPMEQSQQSQKESNLQPKFSTGKWSNQEKQLFLMLRELNDMDYKEMSKIIITRTSEQIRSHAQKVQKKEQRQKEKQQMYGYGSAYRQRSRQKRGDLRSRREKEEGKAEKGQKIYRKVGCTAFYEKYLNYIKRNDKMTVQLCKGAFSQKQNYQLPSEIDAGSLFINFIPQQKQPNSIFPHPGQNKK